MRWIWSGVLLIGMLLILWGVFETSQGMAPDPTRYYGEDGTPLPPPDPPKPPSRT